MKNIFKRPAIKHYHLANILGISQLHLVEFIRNKQHSMGVTRRGLKEDATFPIDEALAIMAIHQNTDPAPFLALLRSYQPIGKQPAAPAVDPALVLKAIIGTSIRITGPKTDDDKRALASQGVRIERDELWIGASTPGAISSLEAAGIATTDARESLLSITGAETRGTKKFMGHASRATAIPMTLVMALLDA